MKTFANISAAVLACGVLVTSQAAPTTYDWNEGQTGAGWFTIDVPAAFGTTHASSFAGGPGALLTGVWADVVVTTASSGAALAFIDVLNSAFVITSTGSYGDGVEAWNAFVQSSAGVLTERPTATPDNGSTICLLAAAMGVLPLVPGSRH